MATKTPTPKPAAVYALTDPSTGEVRYIGKANCPAARLATHLRESGRLDRPVHRWIRKLRAAGAMPSMVVLEEAADWREAERRLIAQYRAAGARLLNVAEGGDEPHCPVAVLRSNGVASAKARNPVVHRLLCDLGRNAKWLRGQGRVTALPKIEAAQARLRSMSAAEQSRFAAAWEKSHGIA